MVAHAAAPSSGGPGAGFHITFLARSILGGDDGRTLPRHCENFHWPEERLIVEVDVD